MITLTFASTVSIEEQDRIIQQAFPSAFWINHRYNDFTVTVNQY